MLWFSKIASLLPRVRGNVGVGVVIIAVVVLAAAAAVAIVVVVGGGGVGKVVLPWLSRYMLHCFTLGSIRIFLRPTSSEGNGEWRGTSSLATLHLTPVDKFA